jgi:hypothetical protein
LYPFIIYRILNPFDSLTTLLAESQLLFHPNTNPDIIGPPPSLPVSMLGVQKRARLVDCIDSPLIAGSLLHDLTDKEKAQRLNFVAELGRSFLTDVNDGFEIKNLIHRCWAGCLSAAKEIALSTKSGLNSSARRTMIVSRPPTQKGALIRAQGCK